MSDKANEGREMPKYKCHKEVWALQIAKIEYDSEKAQKENRETDGSGIIFPVEDGYPSFKVSRTYLLRHTPEASGYYVVYEDGYVSYSPEKTFKNGYTKV